MFQIHTDSDYIIFWAAVTVAFLSRKANLEWIETEPMGEQILYIKPHPGRGVLNVLGNLWAQDWKFESLLSCVQMM